MKVEIVGSQRLSESRLSLVFGLEDWIVFLEKSDGLS